MLMSCCSRILSESQNPCLVILSLDTAWLVQRSQSCAHVKHDMAEAKWPAQPSGQEVGLTLVHNFDGFISYA